MVNYLPVNPTLRYRMYLAQMQDGSNTTVRNKKSLVIDCVNEESEIAKRVPDRLLINRISMKVEQKPLLLGSSEPVLKNISRYQNTPKNLKELIKQQIEKR